MATDIEDIEGEIWVDIPGYDGMYQVSNFGRVKSLKRYSSAGKLLKERILKFNTSQTGSLSVSLYSDGTKEGRTVAYWMGISFLRELRKGECYYHVNKEQSDNRLDNIAIGTTGQSIKVDYAKGLRPITIGDTARELKQDYDELYNTLDPNTGLNMRFCPACGINKPFTDFYYTGSYIRRRCKVCD
jgi:hypothetical protein